MRCSILSLPLPAILTTVLSLISLNPPSVASSALPEASHLDPDNHPRFGAVHVRGPLIPRKVSENLQSFNGSLGTSAQPIINSGNTQRQFVVDGDTFVRTGSSKWPAR